MGGESPGGPNLTPVVAVVAPDVPLSVGWGLLQRILGESPESVFGRAFGAGCCSLPVV